MLTDVNWTVRCEAAMCLAEMPVTYSLESIVAVYLAEEDEFVRRDLAYLIGKTKSTARANTLRELLNTEQEPIARVGLLATLHKLGEKDVLDPMLEYYNHEDRMLHRNLTNTFWDLNFTIKEKRHIVLTFRLSRWDFRFLSCVCRQLHSGSLGTSSRFWGVPANFLDVVPGGRVYATPSKLPPCPAAPEPGFLSGLWTPRDVV